MSCCRLSVTQMHRPGLHVCSVYIVTLLWSLPEVEMHSPIRQDAIKQDVPSCSADDSLLSVDESLTSGDESLMCGDESLVSRAE